MRSSETAGPAALSRRSLLRAAAILGAGAALGAPLRVLAREAEQWPAVTRLLESYVQDRRVANMVAVLGRGQAAPQVIARGHDSFVAPRASDHDSLYRIYSMTKPVTGMAAMMLVEDGAIALDQPLAEILPAFAAMQVLRSADGPLTPDNLEPAVRPITIRHLLTHTAGLDYGFSLDEDPAAGSALSRAYRQAGLVPAAISRVELPGQVRAAPPPSLALFAERLASLPLAHQPGTRWHYSVGLDLLGRVIEVASGVPFDAFLQQRIFEPCGMASTFFQVPPSEVDRLTTSYLVLNELLVPIDLPASSIFLDPPPFPFGGAGLVSSPRDYDRFLMMLAGYGTIEGRRVMSEAAVRMGTSDLLPDTLAPDGGFAPDAGFGAGGLVQPRGGQGGTFGWFGAAGTVGFVEMDGGLRQSLYTQYLPSAAYPLQSLFGEAVAADLAEAEPAA